MKGIYNAEHKSKLIVGESGCELIKRNYSKMALLSAIAKGNEVVILDDGEEYKSICDALDVDYITKKSSN